MQVPSPVNIGGAYSISLLVSLLVRLLLQRPFIHAKQRVRPAGDVFVPDLHDALKIMSLEFHKIGSR